MSDESKIAGSTQASDESCNTGRRAFLGAAAAAAVLAPGLGVAAHAFEARPNGVPASSKQRWGMLVDTTKCAPDCHACVDACNTEMGLRQTAPVPDQAQYIRQLTVKDPSTGYAHYLPVMCQHCTNPACVSVCPTGASMKRADGIVLVDRHLCIGCRYCMMACPYKARSFTSKNETDQKWYNPRGKGCVEGCTFCAHRVDEGREPACVEACNKSGGKGMVFGDLKDPNSEIAKREATEPTTQIRADLGMDPGVRYQGI
jgi:molybdopterin-containing oxidoreductase family iron-sulfur binding subunit